MGQSCVACLPLAATPEAAEEATTFFLLLLGIDRSRFGTRGRGSVPLSAAATGAADAGLARRPFGSHVGVKLTALLLLAVDRVEEFASQRVRRCGHRRLSRPCHPRRARRRRTPGSPRGRSRQTRRRSGSGSWPSLAGPGLASKGDVVVARGLAGAPTSVDHVDHPLADDR